MLNKQPGGVTFFKMTLKGLFKMVIEEEHQGEFLNQSGEWELKAYLQMKRKQHFKYLVKYVGNSKSIVRSPSIITQDLAN